MQKRRTAIAVKILVAVIAMLLVTTIVVPLYFSYIATNLVNENTFREAEATARNIAFATDVEMLEGTFGEAERITYIREQGVAFAQMLNNRECNGIFTLAEYDDENFTFLNYAQSGVHVSKDCGSARAEGDIFPKNLYPIEVKQVFESGVGGSMGVECVDEIKSIMAFMPVLSQDGRVIAVTAVDMAERNVAEVIGKSVISGFVFIALINIIGLVLYFALVKSIVITPLKKLQAAAVRIGRKDMSFELDIESNDEISDIAKILDGDVRQAFLELETRNEKIADSIQYAKSIQKGIMPRDEELAEVFSDFKHAWRPKDIVGGDFYWLKRFQNGFVFALGDCTGHGVPGALMSILSMSILSYIVTEENCSSPKEIIKKLDSAVYSRLNSGSEKDEIKNGLDIGIVYVGNNEKVIYSSTSVPLFYTVEGKTYMVKGSRGSVGEGKLLGKVREHIIDCPSETRFTLMTDGMCGQIAEKTGLPFGYKSFVKIFAETGDKSCEVVHVAIEQEFDRQRGSEQRRDDLTVFSFRRKMH